MSDAPTEIARDTVVRLQYRLTDPSGKELDASTPEGPLLYLHGHRNIVPGLEEALEGKAVGDRVEVEVPPEKGYGRKQKVKPQKMLRSRFPEDARVEKGARFMMQGPEGRPTPIYVTKVMGREVHVTTQHPLAGVTLCFDCTIERIRPATDEEKAHGHPHGDDGTEGHE
jgi:FKBP-type peptidyl-prolyl cis-trans isomerase SlyD